MLALGPVFNVAHMISPLKYIAPFTKEISVLVELFGVKDFLPNDKVSN